MAQVELSQEQLSLLGRAEVNGGSLPLDDGDAVDEAVTTLLGLGLLFISVAVGEDRLIYRLTPAGQAVAREKA